MNMAEIRLSSFRPTGDYDYANEAFQSDPRIDVSRDSIADEVGHVKPHAGVSFILPYRHMVLFKGSNLSPRSQDLTQIAAPAGARTGFDWAFFSNAVSGQ